jgi:hypothetical protein
MPGIVTHSRVLKESILLLSKKDKKSYLLRSIQSLFNTTHNFNAGLFGAIGPNIFDYIPKRNIENYYGNETSFFFHNGGAGKLLKSMIEKLYAYQDKNNEWAAAQRAYVYGFISHIITDSVFHPFIFYYSGFPNTYTQKEIYFYREQNLLFQYNLDNFIQYHAEKANEFSFNLDEMLPVKKRRLISRLDPAVTTCILDSVKQAYPEIYQKLLLQHPKKSESESPAPLSYVDIMPYLIRTAYKIKRSNNRRLANFFIDLLRKNILYSDFIVSYPLNRRFNKNTLNLHRERWEHPAGKPGLHYESIYNLLMTSCEKTVAVWEKIESSLYGKINTSVLDDLHVNAYTGDPKLTYHDMKIKRPIRLSNAI